MGQDSSSWLVFEFKCLASKTTFIASPFGIKIKGFKNVVPIVCFHLKWNQFVLLYCIFQGLVKVYLVYLCNELVL